MTFSLIKIINKLVWIISEHHILLSWMKTESELHPRPRVGNLSRCFSMKLSRFFWRARRRRIYLIYLVRCLYYIIIMRMRRNYCSLPLTALLRVVYYYLSYIGGTPHHKVECVIFFYYSKIIIIIIIQSTAVIIITDKCAHFSRR